MLKLKYLIALALVGASFATATTVFDQQNTSSDDSFGPSTAAGQSFTPTLTGINFATFDISAPTGSAVVTVDLLAGDGYSSGSVLASTPSLVIANTTAQTTEFDFASLIPLTPGSVFTLRLSVTSGSIFESDADGDPYAGGVEYGSTGVAQTGFDLVFAEGIQTTPEPATWSTFALACVAGGLYRRTVRRARSNSSAT